MRGSAKTYRVFVRNWWRRATEPGDPRSYFNEGVAVVPDSGALKTTIATHCTEQEALDLCEAYAAKHKPGPLSRKAEYESE